MVYRTDKCGIMFRVIIHSLLIRVFGVVNWCLLVVLRGDNVVPIFQICYICNMKYAFSSLYKWSTTGSLVKQGRRISVAVCYLSQIAKTIPNFHCVCELLPFVKKGLFSDENTILTACAKTFQMLQFIHMVLRKDKCGIRL